MTSDRPDPYEGIPDYGTPPGTPAPPVPDRPEPTPPKTDTWEEVRSPKVLLTFDGRILEVFADNLRYDTGGGWCDSVRFHIGRLTLKEEQDRKGRRRVYMQSGRINIAFRFEPHEWTTVGPFLSRVVAAQNRWRQA